jgi:CHAT domain-containing protein/Tfp pilus assembly protein PilF
VYYNLGQHKKALTSHHKALAIHREIEDRKGEGGALTNIGVVYDELGQNEKALSYYLKALVIHREIGDRTWEGIALSNIGVVYSNLGQYLKAHQSFEESLKICQKIGAPETLWKAQRGLGRVEAKLEKYDAAVSHYEQALYTIEGMRAGLSEKEVKTSFMRGKLFVYDEFIALLQTLYEKDHSKGYDKKSLEIFERKQGRVFLEEIGKSGARNFAGIPDEITGQENQFASQLLKVQSDLVKERSKPKEAQNVKRIRNLEDRMEKIKQEQEVLKEKIKAQYPVYHAMKYPRPVSLKELQQKVLTSGEMILVYGVMEKKTCLWVIGKEHFTLHSMDMGTKDLAKMVRQYRNRAINILGGELRGMVKQKGAQEKKHDISALSSLLLPRSVQKAITSAKTLYIVPTGPLYLLPFETLKTRTTKDKGCYLIEDHAIAYLSSASLLKILQDAQVLKKQKPAYPLLAFANPVYEKSSESSKDDRTVRGLRVQSYRSLMGGQFVPLPETEEEVLAIKEILKASDKSTPLRLKKEASCSTVMKLNNNDNLDDYRYLVFACHGILPGDVDRVTQPALVLCDPDPETRKDGFLTMADVFSLKLNASLVTLSACNTGRGKSVKGEGVMGLTRAFMYAGTPAITVTLWSVESRSAKDLNVGLFRNLKSGKGRAEALRAIKLRMIRGEHGDQWRHPFFWAPVVVFGDGR